MADDVELCSGCGAVAAQHPMVGVARDAETGEMAAFPICLPCWTTPAHRTTPLKMHFFERRYAPQAVQDAANNIMVSPPTYGLRETTTPPPTPPPTPKPPKKKRYQ